MSEILTTKWKTIRIVGYSHSVSRDENRAAHGGVCLIQGRKSTAGKIQRRLINSNGNHQEVGEPHEWDAEEFAACVEAAKRDK